MGHAGRRVSALFCPNAKTYEAPPCPDGQESRAGAWAGSFSPEQAPTSFVFLCFQGLSFPNPKSSPSWSKGLSYGWQREEFPRAAVQVRTCQVGTPDRSSCAAWKGWRVGIPEKGYRGKSAKGRGQWGRIQRGPDGQLQNPSLDGQ